MRSAPSAHPAKVGGFALHRIDRARTKGAGGGRLVAAAAGSAPAAQVRRRRAGDARAGVRAAV